MANYSVGVIVTDTKLVIHFNTGPYHIPIYTTDV